MSLSLRDPKTPRPEDQADSATGFENEMGNTTTTPNDTGDTQTVINIVVEDQEGSRVNFRIRRVRSLSKIIDAYCQYKNIRDPTSARFFYDGRRIQEKDTAESLEMGPEARIDFYWFQEGGGDF